MPKRIGSPLLTQRSRKRHNTLSGESQSTPNLDSTLDRTSPAKWKANPILIQDRQAEFKRRQDELEQLEAEIEELELEIETLEAELEALDLTPLGLLEKAKPQVLDLEKRRKNLETMSVRFSRLKKHFHKEYLDILQKAEEENVRRKEENVRRQAEEEKEASRLEAFKKERGFFRDTWLGKELGLLYKQQQVPEEYEQLEEVKSPVRVALNQREAPDNDLMVAMLRSMSSKNKFIFPTLDDPEEEYDDSGYADYDLTHYFNPEGRFNGHLYKNVRTGLFYWTRQDAAYQKERDEKISSEALRFYGGDRSRVTDNWNAQIIFQVVENRVKASIEYFGTENGSVTFDRSQHPNYKNVVKSREMEQLPHKDFLEDVEPPLVQSPRTLLSACIILGGLYIGGQLNSKVVAGALAVTANLVLDKSSLPYRKIHESSVVLKDVFTDMNRQTQRSAVSATIAAKKAAIAGAIVVAGTAFNIFRGAKDLMSRGYNEFKRSMQNRGYMGGSRRRNRRTKRRG